METTDAVKRLSALAQDARLDVFRLLVKAGPEGLAAGEIARGLDEILGDLIRTRDADYRRGLGHGRPGPVAPACRAHQSSTSTPAAYVGGQCVPRA